MFKEWICELKKCKVLSRMYRRCVPRLVDGRGWWPSEMTDVVYLKSSLEVVHGAALFHNLTNLESLLHLVRGGNVGM